MVLTPMQKAAFDAICNQQNVQLFSPTGSGKTLAFVLPIASRISVNVDIIQAVVVVPSRELALQIENVVSRHTESIRVMSLYGGRATSEEYRRLKTKCPQFIIVTPGRLLDHVGKNNIDINGVKTLVLDEYDKCLELGFHKEMEQIGIVFRKTPQLILTSATPIFLLQGKEREKLDIWPSNQTDASPLLLNKRNFTVLDFLEQEENLEERLEKFIVNSPQKDKLQTLAQLLTILEQESVIVFVSHRESVERIATSLIEMGFVVAYYHGGMDQEKRERALARFRAGAATILVSTDLAARGLDISMVRSVVHYHLPLNEAIYKHRTGRTARWKDNGKVYLLLSPEESVPNFVGSGNKLFLSEVMIKPMSPIWALIYIGRGKKDKLSKADVLGFLCKRGKLNASQIGHIELTAYATYVAVKRTVLTGLLQHVAGEKIKGMKTILEEQKEYGRRKSK